MAVGAHTTVGKINMQVLGLKIEDDEDEDGGSEKAEDDGEGEDKIGDDGGFFGIHPLISK